MTDKTCLHCFFNAVATCARAAGDRWTAEHMTSMASPQYRIAMEFEAMAINEPRVCCDAAPKPPSKWLTRMLE